MGILGNNQNSKQNSGAALIASGIFLSRIAGLIRERALAHYFGNSDVSDAFKAALKIPNFLQNLFGEGALSASFIPVYSELIAKKEQEKAKNVAVSIFYLLLFLISILCTLGIFLTPMLINLIAPGFEASKKELTIELVQILFPGTGILVLSAWCLGVLNSHRNFFLSYVAPVVWNFSIITTLIIFGEFILITKLNFEYNLVLATCAGVSIGALLQFLIQLPKTLSFISLAPKHFSLNDTNVKRIIKNFIPALLSRGIVQISAYIDNIIASFLSSGAISGLAFSQTLSTLPISLFGMSISQAELTNLSHAQGQLENEEQRLDYLTERLQLSFRRLNFFIIPTIFCFIFLGDFLIAALFQTGQFTSETTHYVWTILMASSFGLLGSTKGRVITSSFYALKDTKTPMYIALLRVVLTSLLGIYFSLYLYKVLGIESYYQAAFLGLSFSLASSLDYFILKIFLEKKINRKLHESWTYFLKISAISLFAALISFCLKFSVVNEFHPIIKGALVAGTYGLVFILIAMLLKIDEVNGPIKKIKNKLNLK